MTRSNHRLPFHPLNIKKAKALGHVSHWFDALEPRKMLSGQGLLAQYFDNPDLTGTAVHHDVHAVVDEDWGMGSPANALHADAFSIRWTGKVEAQYSQAYTFTVTAQGGVRLWVNNQQIINQWTAEGSESFSGNISLTANQKYDIRLEYRETAGDAGVSLLWSSASQTQQVIPLARLSHWLQTQIGSGVTGSMSYNSGTGVYTIQGSGSDLVESSNTHFTYQTISGDAEIVARLVSKSNDWSSVGLMIRDGLGTGAQSYALVLSDNGKVFGISSATTGKSIDLSRERYAPVWMRVVRKGDTLTGYVSQDGEVWVALWGRNINMSEAVQVGFAVSSHSTTSRVTATFDNVRISSPQWDHDTSWLGNTFNGAGQWVQNDIKGFYVAPDGTIFTSSPWDEGGSEAGVYKDQQNLGRLANLHGWGRSGGWAVTADSNYVYALVGQDYLGWDATGYPSSGQYWNVIARYHRSTFASAPFTGGEGHDGSFRIVNTNGSRPTGIHVSGNQLFVSDPTSNIVRIYNKNTMNQTGSFSVARPGQITEDSNGYLWIISNADGSNAAKVLQYSKTGVKQSREITGIVKPTSIAFNTTNGQLLVADDGPSQQIHIFSITPAIPVLVGTLGEYGGMTAGVVGQVTPTKFDNPSGVGVDAQGNIYVAFQGMEVNFTWIGLGAVIRKFSPTGQFLWEMHGLEFVDSAVADPTNDGLSVYTKDARYEMDYTKSNGQEYTWVGRTVIEGLNNDPRLTGGDSSVWMQEVNGQKFMYATGQGGMNLSIYRFVEGSELAIQCGAILETATWIGLNTYIWMDHNGDGIMQQSTEVINTGASRREDGYGISIDSNGAVWISGIHSGLRKYTMTSINTLGVPIFSASVQSSFPLSPITNLGRAIYEPETDSMFLSGYTSANPRDGTLWGEAGRELVRINNWSGSRTLAWRTVLPYDTDPPAGDIVTVKSISMAGNRIIATMGTTGAVIAYDKTTGQKVADLARGPEIGGYGGWLDTVQPVSAFQRSNGEYLIFVEEDLLAKIIMYRTGAITPTGLTAVVNAAGGIDLAWTDNCDRESGFELEQSTDGINFTTIATLDINTQQHTIDSPTPGQNLTFRIRATHSFDDSPYSNTATVEVEPPTQLWFYDDIGNVGLAGSANENQGVWTITSSGADIWGNSDQFGYLYQTIRGDFDLSARVSSITLTHEYAKAGVMVRESLAADAKHASMFITGSNGTEFLHRALTAGSSVAVVGQVEEAPVWVRLVRQGNLLSAYESLDGSTWNIAGSSTVVMNEMVYVGLAVTSHNNSLLNASTFDSLSVTQLWSFTDIGSVGLTGSATQNQGVWTVLGSGTDIWDNADQFGYLYQPVSGDFQMSARINSITVTDSWSKAGVMVRETLTSGSRHASMFLTGSNGAAFQYRSNTSSSSGHIAGGAASAPLWVRVVREGEELTSYRSADGNAWTLVGSTTIAMGEDIYVGLAVTSHNNSLINTSVFEQLTIEPLDTQAPMMLSAPAINAESNGNLSRSQVNSVTWTFSEPVFAAKHNLTLKNLDTGSIVDLSSRTFTVDGSRLTLLLDQKSMDQASGPQLFLANGNYELILSGVTDHVGNPLIATSNNTTGSTVALRFHKLVGDYNGDRKVNSTDYLNWRQHFGKSVSDSVNQSYDLDGDGKVTSADYLLWRQHLNLSLLEKGSGMIVY